MQGVWEQAMGREEQGALQDSPEFLLLLVFKENMFIRSPIFLLRRSRACSSSLQALSASDAGANSTYFISICLLSEICLMLLLFQRSCIQFYSEAETTRIQTGRGRTSRVLGRPAKNWAQTCLAPVTASLWRV